MCPFPEIPFNQSNPNFENFFLGDIKGEKGFPVLMFMTCGPFLTGMMMIVFIYINLLKCSMENWIHHINIIWSKQYKYIGTVVFHDLDTVLAVQAKTISFFNSHITLLAHIRLRINLNSLVFFIGTPTKPVLTYSVTDVLNLNAGFYMYCHYVSP